METKGKSWPKKKSYTRNYKLNKIQPMKTIHVLKRQSEHPKTCNPIFPRARLIRKFYSDDNEIKNSISLLFVLVYLD